MVRGKQSKGNLVVSCGIFLLTVGSGGVLWLREKFAEQMKNITKISGYSALFSEPYKTRKSRDRAGHFEYHEPSKKR